MSLWTEYNWFSSSGCRNACEDCNEPSRFMRDCEFKQWRNHQHDSALGFKKKSRLLEPLLFQLTC